MNSYKDVSNAQSCIIDYIDVSPLLLGKNATHDTVAVGKSYGRGWKSLADFNHPISTNKIL